MTIASRTPEGLPFQCSICGKRAALEPSSPTGDVTCPSCGRLLWWFRDRLSGHMAINLGIRPEEFSGDFGFLNFPFQQLGFDSLDIVEFMMELEEEFGISIPDEEADNMKTIADVIRYLVEHLDGDSD